MKTKLWHKLPAILDGDSWLVISADFTNIARIPLNEIDKPEIFTELDKLNFFVEEIIDKKVFQLTLITTSDCNLQCRYCFANSGESSLIMSKEIAEASVRHGFEKSKDKVLSIAFFGGEPSLTSTLIGDTVSYALKNIPPGHKGVEFSITTNGVISESFLNFLIDKKFKITLSADGPAFIQNYHRPTKSGGESSIHVERTIRALVQSNTEFKLRVTVTEFSVHEMSKIVLWFKELGGKEIHFEPVTISGRALKAGELTLKQPSVSDFTEGLQKAIQVGCAVDLGIINSSFMNISSPPPEFCDGNSNQRIAVSYTGDVTTCVEVQDRCHQAASDFIIGNFDESKNEIIINRESRTTKCSGFVPSDCSDCFALKICGGGCPVRNFHATGSLEKVDSYRCQLIKNMIPFIIKLCDLES